MINLNQLKNTILNESNDTKFLTSNINKMLESLTELNAEIKASNSVKLSEKLKKDVLTASSSIIGLCLDISDSLN